MVLHILNGDSTRESLEQSGVGGRCVVWADVLHDGPVPEGLSDEELRAVRARHIASRPEDVPEVLAQLNGWDAALQSWQDYDEVVFWFEHDLFDQLLLIRHLDWMARAGVDLSRFRLICIGAHPEVPDFAGLGQLSPRQLRDLYPIRQPITPREVEVGAQAWRLFRSSDPTELVKWAASPAAAVLPFLPGALRRLLDEYPNADGLSRSERQILRAIADGADTFVGIYRATQRMEERIFMGDLSFEAILKGLTDATRPLVVELNGRFEVTPAGRDVLTGRADHIALNGIDRWIGGVHLTSQRLWRWDGSRLNAEV